MTDGRDLLDGRAASSRRGLPDRLWVPALAALVIALAFVGALLVRADGDVSLLVHAGPPWTSADEARGSLTVQAADEAFDGQFFYRLGIDPWSTEETVDGVTFDLPALRNARWGYGALAFVASAGDPDLVPWALVGINVVAFAAVGALGGALAQGLGRHAAWGLLLALWPGFAYSLSMDTSELVASAFLLAGLLAVRRRAWALAALGFTAAVLTRDTTAAVPFGVAVAGAWTWWSAGRSTTTPDVAVEPAQRSSEQQGSPRARRAVGLGQVVAGAVPLVAFGVWQLVQRSRFGELPLTSSGDNNLSAPMIGLADQLGELAPPSGGEEAFRLLCIFGLWALIVAAAFWWWRSSTPIQERVAWLPTVLVVAMINDYLWSGATAFARAATEAGLLSILVILGTRRRLVLPATALGLAGFFALTAVAHLSKLG